MKQPWAWAIVHGGKDVENRVRSLGPYRGPVAIHAGLGWAPEGATNPNVLGELCAQNYIDAPIVEANGYAEPEMDEFAPRGAVIGVVDLVAVHGLVLTASGGTCRTYDERLAEPLCSPWAMDRHYHLQLANPRLLPRPIPATGRLGLWRPDDALLAAITEQLGAAA